MTRRLASWLLPYYAGARLPKPLRRWMNQALREDPVLAQHYASLRQLERKVARHDGLSDAQRNLLCANLFDALEITASEQKIQAQPTPQRGRFPNWGFQFSPVAMAVAALLLFAFLPNFPPTKGDVSDDTSAWMDGFRARGTHGELASSALPPEMQTSQGHVALGMRVRCVQGSAVMAEAVVGARQPETRLDCGEDGLLAFSGTNLSQKPQYAFVLGIGKDNSILWLPPFSEGSAATELPAKSVDEVLSQLTPMTTLSDRVDSLLILFSDRPFAGTHLQRQINELNRRALPLAQMAELPLDYPVQARIKVRKIR